MTGFFVAGPLDDGDAVSGHYYEAASPDPARAQVWGYTDKLSYAPGEVLRLHAMSNAAEIAVTIRRDGLAPQDVQHLTIQGGFADSRILQLHGQRMVDRDFAPKARMGVQLKDMRNALGTAKEIGFDAPVTTLFEALYAEGVEHGLGELDHSGLFVELASRNAMQ